MGILPRQERSSWGFIWPFVAHKMSLCVGFFTGQGARATQSGELPRDPDAWRLVTRETSEALQKCWFSLLGKLLFCHGVAIKFFCCCCFFWKYYFHHTRSFSDNKKRSWFGKGYNMNSINTKQPGFQENMYFSLTVKNNNN